MKSLFSKNYFSYMRILAALIVLVMSSSIMNAADPTSPQWVSTIVQKKNVVLEEYTGWRCMHCPDGHKRAQQLAASNPGRAFITNIHASGYGSPNPAEEGWNLVTIEGDTMVKYSGLTGYPAGSVNRSTTPWAMNRGSWVTVANEIMTQNSPVNIFVKAYLNHVSRKMIVEVELYYTANSESSTNKLTVMLLQNEIIGGQKDDNGSGVAYYPEMHLGVINASNSIYRYRHQHALRKFISPGGPFGEDITTTTQGSYIYKKYELDIPQTIIDANIPVELEHLEVLAFIAEGQSNIYTGVAVVPSTEDLANLTLISNPEGAGILTGADDYKKGEKVTITAAPSSEEYTFINWTNKNGQVLSTNSSYELTINSDTVITANFNFEKRYYAYLTVEPDEDAGVITGLKEYYLTDEFCQLTATANEGYKFRGWFSGASSSPNANLSLKMTKDEYITARFVAEPVILSQTHNVTVATGEQILLQVNVKADTCGYQWFKNEAKIEGANDNTYSISFAAEQDAGIYFCEISNFAATIASEPIQVTVTSGIKATTITELKINPNPTKDNINVSLDLEIAGNLNISLANILGEELLGFYNKFTEAGTFADNFSIKTLPIGTYFLKINHNGNVIIEKIIKE
ncbi:MAG: Omp28-related outer membrane protein [Bacteroidetes bacterium]|nr:Omp28-related outer membrane protein [Bacteroidota bacterium]